MEAELPEGKIHHQRMPADDVTRDYLKVLFIEHEPDKCVWCDAMRWRALPRWIQDAYLAEESWHD